MKILDIRKVVQLADDDLFLLLGNEVYKLRYVDGEVVELPGSYIYLDALWQRTSLELNLEGNLTTKYSWYKRGDIYNLAIIDEMFTLFMRSMPEDSTAIERSTVVADLRGANYHRLYKIGILYQMFPNLYDLYELADIPELDVLRDKVSKEPTKSAKRALEVIMAHPNKRNNILRMIKVGNVKRDPALDNVFSKGYLTQATSGVRMAKPIREPLLDIHRARDSVMMCSEQHIAADAHQSKLGETNYTLKRQLTVASGIISINEQTCGAGKRDCTPIEITEDNHSRIVGSYYYLQDSDVESELPLGEHESANFIGSVLYVRTSLSCLHDDGTLCKRCIGTLANAYTRGNLGVNLSAPGADKVFNTIMKTKHNLRYIILSDLSKLTSEFFTDTDTGWAISTSGLNKETDLDTIEIVVNLDPYSIELLNSDAENLPDSTTVTEIRVIGYNSEGDVITEEHVNSDNNPEGFKLAGSLLAHMRDHPHISQEGDIFTLTINLKDWEKDNPLFTSPPHKRMELKDQITHVEAQFGAGKLDGVPLSSCIHERIRTILKLSNNPIYKHESLAALALRLRSHTVLIDPATDKVINANPQPVSNPNCRIVSADTILRVRSVEATINVMNGSTRGYIIGPMMSRSNRYRPCNPTYLEWRYKALTT